MSIVTPFPGPHFALLFIRPLIYSPDYSCPPVGLFSGEGGGGYRSSESTGSIRCIRISKILPFVVSLITLPNYSPRLNFSTLLKEKERKGDEELLESSSKRVHF